MLFTKNTCIYSVYFKKMPAIKEESENLFFEQFTSAATSSSQVQEAAQTQPKTMDHKHHEIKSEIGENYYEEPETDEPQIMTKKDTFTVEKKPSKLNCFL